jgi:hypothetical protein
MINACSVLVEKPGWKTPLGRQRFRWEDNIKMHLREIRWEGVTRCIWLRIETSDGLL